MQAALETVKDRGHKSAGHKPAGPSPCDAASSNPILTLQQQAGNPAVQAFLRQAGIHPKLAISQPDDPDEREADQVAARVMRSHSGLPLSSCACAAGGDMCEECEEKQSGTIARKAEGGGTGATPQVVADGDGGSAHQTQTPVVAPGLQTSSVPQAPCGGNDKASAYTPTEQGLNPETGLGSLFGVTSKLPARVVFGACKVGDSWHFHLTDLVVAIASAVQPENFRTNVNAADDPAVTRENYRKVVQDLSPTAEGDDTHHCGGADFPEHITHYSHRRHFWKHQLTIEHEAFHRNDWNTMYRVELVQAQSQVWQFTLPAASASTPEAAVSHAAQTLHGYFTDAYNRTCQRYAPQQETRAYTAGASGYQALVDAIQARATAEGWDRPTQQPGQQPPPQPSPQAPHHP